MSAAHEQTIEPGGFGAREVVIGVPDHQTAPRLPRFRPAAGKPGLIGRVDIAPPDDLGKKPGDAEIAKLLVQHRTLGRRKHDLRDSRLFDGGKQIDDPRAERNVALPAAVFGDPFVRQHLIGFARKIKAETAVVIDDRKAEKLEIPLPVGDQGQPPAGEHLVRAHDPEVNVVEQRSVEVPDQRVVAVEKTHRDPPFRFCLL